MSTIHQILEHPHRKVTYNHPKSIAVIGGKRWHREMHKLIEIIETKKMLTIYSYQQHNNITIGEKIVTKSRNRY
jgi:hypothetical protein